MLLLSYAEHFAISIWLDAQLCKATQPSRRRQTLQGLTPSEIRDEIFRKIWHLRDASAAAELRVTYFGQIRLVAFELLAAPRVV
jgi:hypothetical protein